MKNLIRIVFIVFSAFIVDGIISNSNGPGGGYSGAPSENNCTNCHGTFSLQTSGVNFNRIKLEVPFTGGGYIPDSTYLIKISYKETGKSVFGFQVTALDVKNNEAAGTFTANDSRTQTGNYTISGKTRYYAEHTSSGTSTVATDSVAWFVRWKAPNKNLGSIRFHLNLNVANANGSTSGDYIYKKSFDVVPSSLLPKASATIKDSIICSGKSIQFTGSGTQSPTSYQWSFPGGSSTSSTSQNPQITYSSIGNYIAVLTVKNSKGSSVPDTLRFKVLQGASKPTTNLSGAVNLCNGDSLRLNANNISGHTLSWMPINNKKNSLFVKDSGVYFAMSTNSVGCTRNSDNIIVKLLPKPIAKLETLDGKVEYCINSKIPLIVKSLNGLADSFSVTGANVGYIKDSNFIKNAILAGTNSFNAWVKSSNGCISVPNKISLEIKDSLQGPTLRIADTQLTQVKFAWSHTLGDKYQYSTDKGKNWQSPTQSDSADSETVKSPTANFSVDFWLKSLNNHVCEESKISKIRTNTLACKAINYEILAKPVTKSCADSMLILTLKTDVSNYRWSINEDTLININVFSYKLKEGKNLIKLSLMNSDEFICGFTDKQLEWNVDSIPNLTWPYMLNSSKFCRANATDTIQVPLELSIKKQWKEMKVGNNLFSNSLFFPEVKTVAIVNRLNPKLNVTIQSDSGCFYTFVSESVLINELPSADFKISNVAGGYNYKFTPDSLSYDQYSWMIGDSVTMLSNPEINLYEYRGNRILISLKVIENGNGCENNRQDSLIVTFLNVAQPKFQNKISVYPNPVNTGSMLYIDYPNKLDGKINAKLYTNTGLEIKCEILQSTESTQNLNVGNLIPGIYFIKISEIGKDGSEFLLDEKPIMIVHSPY